MKIHHVEVVRHQGRHGRIFIRHIYYFECPICGRVIKALKSGGLMRKHCILHPRTKHGMSHTPLHRVWTGMLDRCRNPKCKSYHNYGGRGISVCRSWAGDFRKFMKWAFKNGYRRGLLIDRINNNKGYSPGNCRFTTHPKSIWNRRPTKLTPASVVEIRNRVSNGEQQKSISLEFGVSPSVVSQIVSRQLWNAVP